LRFLDEKPETIVSVYDYRKTIILVDPMLD
jgi:hypothetical protein